MTIELLTSYFIINTNSYIVFSPCQGLSARALLASELGKFSITGTVLHYKMFLSICGLCLLGVPCPQWWLPKVSPDTVRCSLGEENKMTPCCEPPLYMKYRREYIILTSHLSVSVWEIWQSCELCWCCPLLHRMWQCHGTRPSGSKVSVHHVLWDCGAPQVNGLSAVSSLSSFQPELEASFLFKYHFYIIIMCLSHLLLRSHHN